jgi:hypothetical protein
MQSSLAKWTCLRYGNVLHSLLVAVVVGACSQPHLYDSPEARTVTHMWLKLVFPDNFRYWLLRGTYTHHVTITSCHDVA